MKHMEMVKKGSFVKKELLNLIKITNEEVIDLNYVVASPSKEEYVEVTYSNFYRKRINVTADSLRAIVIDVMREIH